VIEKILKNIRKIWSRCIDDILLALGMFFLVNGIFLIYIPAAYIALGICFMFLAFITAKKGG